MFINVECVKPCFKKRLKRKSCGLGVNLVLNGFMQCVLTLIYSVYLKSFIVSFVSKIKSRNFSLPHGGGLHLLVELLQHILALEGGAFTN